MKKFLKVSLVILVIALIATNTSREDFMQRIIHSTDPLDEFYMFRAFKNQKAIIKPGRKYYTPIFELDYTNLGLFSYAKINSGWMGTLNFQGIDQGKNVSKETKTTYLIVMGNHIKLQESKQ